MSDAAPIAAGDPVGPDPAVSSVPLDRRDLLQVTSPAAAASSVAVLKHPAAPKRRKRLKLTDAERARRSKHIGQFAAKGGQANVAKHGREGLSKAGKIGAMAQHAQYKLIKMTLQADSPEDIRRMRLELEGKRAKILKNLTAAALGQEDANADCAIMSVALRELRTEIDRLQERERVAEAARAAVGGSAPRLPLAGSVATAAEAATSGGVDAAGAPVIFPD